MTYSEMRLAYSVGQALGKEIFIGKSCYYGRIVSADVIRINTHHNAGIICKRLESVRKRRYRRSCAKCCPTSSRSTRTDCTITRPTVDISGVCHLRFLWSAQKLTSCSILDRLYWVPPVGPPPLAPPPNASPQQVQAPTLQQANSFNSAITNRMSDLTLGSGNGSLLSLGRKGGKDKGGEKGQVDGDFGEKKKGLFKMKKW